MSNNTYDILKKIVTVVLPAVSALYAALASAWGWANSEPIVATIAAVTVFLGVMINVSSSKYNKSGGSDGGEGNA